MKNAKDLIFLTTLAALAGVQTAAKASDAGPGIIINEDNSHFYATRSAEDMTREGLHAFVDQYAGTEVSHLFLSPNAMRASFASKTREAIWEMGDQEMPAETGQRWMNNARLLHERGLDPYAVWIDRCREKGISPWLSMRMNDVHDVPNTKSYMHSTFWLKNPQFWRVPHEKRGGWTDRALDYAHPEVREHAMAFVRELMERYDPDGLELDWMRFGWHFKAGEEAQGAEILTAFMREVRQLTKEWAEKRGHPIALGARVPAHPDAAKGLGMDGVRWAKEGLVDMLVPCPFWTSSDFDIPVGLWKERIGAETKNVVIAPGLEHNTRAFPGGAPVANDLPATRGFAASSWFRGADQIYLFNYMDSGTRPVSSDDYRVLVEQGLGEEVVSTHTRRHIQSYRDTVPLGFDAGIVLPIDTANPAGLRLPIGRKPAKGRVLFIAGLATGEGVEEAQLAVTVNDTPCSALEDDTMPEQYPGAVRALRFLCPLESLRDGYNTLRIGQKEGAPQRVVWAEIRVEMPEA